MSPYADQRGQRIGRGPMVVDNEHAKQLIIDVVGWHKVNRFTRSGGLDRALKPLVRVLRDFTAGRSFITKDSFQTSDVMAVSQSHPAPA